MNTGNENRQDETRDGLRIIIVKRKPVEDWSRNEKVILYMKEDEISILIEQIEEVIPRLHRSRRKDITKLLLREHVKRSRRERIDRSKVREMIRDWKDRMKTEEDLEKEYDPTKINITVDGKIVWT